MDDKAIRILEFDKIISRLSELCTSELGRELVNKLALHCEMAVVSEMLKETTDATDFILRRGNPPLGGIHDIRGSLKRVEIGSVFNPGELLHIANTLRLKDIEKLLRIR